MESFWNGFEKKAEEKDPSWWQKQKGMYRAMRSSDSGVGKVLASNELVGSRIKNSLPRAVLGGLAGVGAGALLHKSPEGMMLGGGLGALGGQAWGQHKADSEYLKNRGIESRWGGLSANFSPEAKKKYIDDHERN